MVSGFRNSPHSFSSSHVASAAGGAARSLEVQRSVSSMQLDIWRSNDAMVEMAIADFFHCENIPDAVVASPGFKRLISVCRLLGDKFVPPNANKLGGTLLDLHLGVTEGGWCIWTCVYGRWGNDTSNATDEYSHHVWYEFSHDCRYY